MQMVPGFRVVDYRSAYGRALVEMWRASFERAVGIVDPHPCEEQLAYLERKVVPENRVLVVVEEASSDVVGFLAVNQEQIAQLYVHVDYQGRGIGSSLLRYAKEHSHGRLRLFTFEANTDAQRFYERRGFKVIARGFEEAWQLADLEYEWRRDQE
ncbi:MAG: GNAT family N-acetyltransferase [Planctomycetota bacterium]